MVRVWCVPVGYLARNWLLGEHSETHIIFNVLQKKRFGIKAGYQNHPQTLRFENRLGQLIQRHNDQVSEMERRGYNHKTPILLVEEPELYAYTPEEYQADLAVLKERGGLLE